MSQIIVKERPILMSGPNIRPILEGRKTQTRRIIKPQPQVTERRLRELGGWVQGMTLSEQVNAAWQSGFVDVKCPHGQHGDRLWVRETHAFIWPDEYEPDNLKDCSIEYRADTDGKALPGDWPEESRDDPERPKWRPSIFMPRWASRIMLEITDIRVERLNEISEEDAWAEGVNVADTLARGDSVGYGPTGKPWAPYLYRSLWESINGSGSWDANPWVWVTEFRRIEG